MGTNLFFCRNHLGSISISLKADERCDLFKLSQKNFRRRFNGIDKIGGEEGNFEGDCSLGISSMLIR